MQHRRCCAESALSSQRRLESPPMSGHRRPSGRRSLAHRGSRAVNRRPVICSYSVARRGAIFVKQATGFKRFCVLVRLVEAPTGDEPGPSAVTEGRSLDSFGVCRSLQAALTAEEWAVNGRLLASRRARKIAGPIGSYYMAAVANLVAMSIGIPIRLHRAQVSCARSLCRYHRAFDRAADVPKARCRSR